MTTPLNPEYDLKALVLAPSDAIGREWAKDHGHTLKTVRVGSTAHELKGYHRDLPVYVLRPEMYSEEFAVEIDRVKERFHVTRETRV